MTDAAERLVNLALFLASAREPVTAAHCREVVAGYPADQDDAAFSRMFERDKEDLRAAGLAIETLVDVKPERYRLDTAATFSRFVDLTDAEAAVLRTAAAAFAADPAFPFAADLRFALAKLVPGVEAVPVAACASGGDVRSAGAASLAAEAVARRKRLSFAYANARGERGRREVEPYGLFLWEGAWYLVGRDTAKDAVRVFNLGRASGTAVNGLSPKSPDFERPADFDVAAYVRLPFQYGTECFEATVRFAPGVAWRAGRLSGGAGSLEPRPDGAVEWRVTVRDGARLLRWTVENGPGVELLEPAALRDTLAARMREVAEAHG